MSGETQQILLVFIFLFSSCSFGLFTLSTIGSKWFSCRSNTPRISRNGNTQYDLIFTLWEYCQRQPNGGYACTSIDGASQFQDVFLGKASLCNFIYFTFMLNFTFKSVLLMIQSRPVDMYVDIF